MTLGEEISKPQKLLEFPPILIVSEIQVVFQEMELTDLEKSESIRIAEIVKGKLVGVDLIPSKDREKIKPYCIEVNANLGFGGLEKSLKGSPTTTILKSFMNRDNWILDN